MTGDVTDSDADPCDACDESTPDPLARTVRLSVDRSNIDTQRLCPECFAEWIARYRTEMRNEADPTPGSATTVGDDGDDIIVD